MRFVPGEEFGIRNLTDEDVTVVFPGGPIDLKLRTIPRGGTAPAKVLVASPRFFEYDVTLLRSGNYAEGGSKPGVIIDD